ncbi:MAG: glycosyltransferase family 2 protein [Patescibacteria group bacterium]
MSNEHSPFVSVILVVSNGARYMRACAKALAHQTYKDIEVIVFDNASQDATRDIVREILPDAHIIEHPKNIGMWPGQIEAMKSARGSFILSLSVDVLLAPQCIEELVACAQKDERIGAVQAKVFQYAYADIANNTWDQSRTIDTCGFGMTRSRRVYNIGQGEADSGQYDNAPLFGVEGAMPFFRKTALLDSALEEGILDMDYYASVGTLRIGYGDDLDIAWRMRLRGWKQVFCHTAHAFHDRTTTKSIATRWWHSLLPSRIRARRAITPLKRQLDWRNNRCTMVKNELAQHLLRDAPFILARDGGALLYALLFDWSVLRGMLGALLLLPRMLKKRAYVQRRVRISVSDMQSCIR